MTTRDRIISLRESAFREADKAIEGSESRAVLLAESEHIGQFFWISEDRRRELTASACAGLRLQRCFIGLDSEDAAEKKAAEKLLRQCKRDIEKLESLKTQRGRENAENRLAKKYEGHLIYKSDEAVSVAASYQMMSHPTEDRELFDRNCELVSLILRDRSPEQLRDPESVRTAASTVGVEVTDSFAEGLAQLLS